MDGECPVGTVATPDGNGLEQTSQFSIQQHWSSGKETPQEESMEIPPAQQRTIHSQYQHNLAEFSKNPHVRPEGASIWTSATESIEHQHLHRLQSPAS